jgi:ABC-type transport system substrate-binding protein
MRKTLSLVALVAGCGLLAASALASARQGPPPNTFRWSLTVDIDYVDPALAYSRPSSMLHYATGAMLFNYPDAPAPRGSRLVPEVAAGFPTISKDGRTYTIRLKRTYRFSDGRRVRAANFVRAFQRARHPRMRSAAAAFLRDVRSADAVGPLTLRIRTGRRAPDLLSRLAMPFFMAVPANLPLNPEGVRAPLPSAGPYFIREWTRNRRIVLLRNRFYRGPRPHNVAQILVDIGLPVETIKLNIDRGATDTGDLPPAAHAELGRRHGVARRSPGRYFVNPGATIHYIAFNHRGGLFGGPTPLGNVRLKRAINFALNRRALMDQFGEYGGITSDQILPPTMRGFRDAAIYPRRPDLARARRLAAGSLRSHIEGTLKCSNRAPSPAVCQIAQRNMREIGLNVSIRPLFPHPPPVEQSSDLYLESWRIDYFDPYNFIFLVDGATIRPANNSNQSFFNDPGYNRKIRLANQLAGAPRYRAFAALDHDLMQNAAPVAVYGVSNDRHYVSARTGCYHHHPVYTYDFPAICLRR